MIGFIILEVVNWIGWSECGVKKLLFFGLDVISGYVLWDKYLEFVGVFYIEGCDLVV